MPVPQAQPPFSVAKPLRRQKHHLRALQGMRHLLLPLLGEALSHAPILNIWTQTRGPSLAFPWSRDRLSLCVGAG